MFIMFFGKISGLIRDIVLNAQMGTESAVRTAFDPALTIPSQFLDFAFAAALSSSFIPVFNDVLQKNDKKTAFALANKFITLIMILSVGLTGLGIVFAPHIIGVFAGGIADAGTKTLAAELLRVMFPTVALTAAAFALTGVLQSLDEFNVPAAMSLLSNIVIIAYFLFFYDKFGVRGLCAAFLVGWGTQIVVQIPSLVKKGYIFRPNFRFKDRNLAEIGKLTLPVVVSTWIVPVNTLVNKRAASTLFDGAGMNALTTANGLYSVVTGVFILSVANVVFPKMAREMGRGDESAFSATVGSTLGAALFFLLPISVILCVLSEPVTRLFFERGAFTAVSTERTAAALAMFAPGMAGLGVQTILCRAFYAEKDAKTPLFAALAAIVANGLLSGVLAQKIGVGGPALASGVSVTLAAAAMAVVCAKRHKAAFSRTLGLTALKSAICAAFSGLAVWGAFKLLPIGGGFGQECIKVVISAIFAIIVYITLAILLKIDESSVIVKLIGRLVKNGRN